MDAVRKQEPRLERAIYQLAAEHGRSRQSSMRSSGRPERLRAYQHERVQLDQQAFVLGVEAGG